MLQIKLFKRCRTVLSVRRYKNGDYSLIIWIIPFGGHYVDFLSKTRKAKFNISIKKCLQNMNAKMHIKKVSSV